MTTRTRKDAVNLPVQQKTEPRPAKRGKTADNTKTEGEQAPRSVEQATPSAPPPRGPFKILTIPQSWYDSLHAAHDPGGDTGKG